MKRAMRLAAAAALLAGLSPGAHGFTAVKTDKLRLDVFGRGQMVGVGQIVPDPVRDNIRVYLFLKQARLGFKGNYEDIRFEIQTAYGGENINGSNTDLGLLDFFADIPLRTLGENVFLKAGQFRVPYSREGLTDRGYMNYAERSIMNLAAFQSRDYGLALLKTWDKWTGTIGVFSGGGRDVPQRYLPEVLGVPEFVARFGYNDGVDQDIYHVVGTDIDLNRTAKAAYVNALFMQDTLIGHSTVINVRTTDKNLLIDSSFNQFISQAPLQRGHLWFVGGDAVIRHPLGGGRAVEAEAEVNWGGYDNRYGALHIAAARAQAGYQFQPYHIGLRYAALLMDRHVNFRSGSQFFSPAVGSAMHEITPSLTWHIKRHNLKVVADAPVLLNMPIFIERGVGAYVFSTQPGQVTVLSNPGNSTKRVSVIEARMLLQFLF